MEETVRALPDAAVQETSFENDAAPVQHDDAEAQAASSRRDPQASSSPAAHDDDNDQPDQSPSLLTSATRSTARALGPDLLRGLLLVLMALDRSSALLSGHPHSPVLDGNAGETDDSIPLHSWNAVDAYVIRLLGHLTMPGLTFLLGTGVVYFGRSRRALGWSAGAMAWHFTVRAVALTVVAVLLGLLITLGRIGLYDIALSVLAFDYWIAGLLWLVLARTEELLAFGLLRVLPDAKEDDAREPLLADRRGEEDIAPDRKIMRAADISWHVHNAVLAALAVVTICSGVWGSATGGRCQSERTTMGPTGSALGVQDGTSHSTWFSPQSTVLAKYPPLAWLSFAIVGLLYGRIATARPWTRTALTLGSAVAGLFFLLIFVLTRLLHVGNLSEGCLHMPEHVAHPDANQYLASGRSFFYLVAYPPEVAFWAFGIGCNLLLLGLLGSLPAMLAATVLQPLVVYGTSALFFYLLHPLLFGLSWRLWRSAFGLPTSENPWLGGGLDGVKHEWVFWVNWAIFLIIMYPLCLGFGAFKRRRGVDSVWQFF